MDDGTGPVADGAGSVSVRVVAEMTQKSPNAGHALLTDFASSVASPPLAWEIFVAGGNSQRTRQVRPIVSVKSSEWVIRERRNVSRGRRVRKRGGQSRGGEGGREMADTNVLSLFDFLLR